MSSQAGLPFFKIVGTGNDFLFLDVRSQPDLGISRSELVRRISNRHTGVGSDGVVFVENNAGEPSLKWDFYNPDGSSAAMCGNALRCMGRWAQTTLQKNQVHFLTLRGPVHVRAQGDVYAAELKGLSIQPKTLKYSLGGETFEAIAVNTGVPHAVVRVSTIDDPRELLRHVPHLRFHADLEKEGANVTFLKVVAASEFETVSFERGVEDFTLSCGTGVLAAAAVGLGVGDARARLKTPGGVLEVIYQNNFSTAQLIGPADMICSGQLEERFLK